MLGRLEELLDTHLVQLDSRISELLDLREEMGRYREHVGRRIQVLGVQPPLKKEKLS